MGSPTPAPPALEPVPQRIVLRLGGTIVADTTRALWVLETHQAPTYYLPLQEIHSTLRPAQGSSFCEWQGVARYFDVLARPTTAPRAALAYDHPTARFAELARHVACCAAQTDEARVGDARVIPQPAISTAAGSLSIWMGGSKARRESSTGSVGLAKRSEDASPVAISTRPAYRVRFACRFAAGVNNPWMPKCTSPSDAGKISVAADLEALVQDKREGWRASGAKSRRRQRRDKALLTQQLLRLGPTAAGEAALDDDA